MGKQTAARVRAAGERIAALGAGLPPHRSMRWCLERSEGLASSDVEGISTTLRSVSLLETQRGEYNPRHRGRDTQALGAVRLTALAAEIARRTDPPFGRSDLQEMHRRLFSESTVAFVPGRLRSDDIWVGTPAPPSRRPAMWRRPLQMSARCSSRPSTLSLTATGGSGECCFTACCSATVPRCLHNTAVSRHR